VRVPLSWLADFVDVELTPEQLAERLTLLGMEVKHLERWGADWQNVVTGELLTVEKHPRADRLHLTTVTLGDGSEPLSIVCGATNIAPGQRIPVALPGAVLPGNRRIERTEKMGVVSNGMLCSGDELRLTGDGDGILILPAGTPLGVPLVTCTATSSSTWTSSPTAVTRSRSLASRARWPPPPGSASACHRSRWRRGAGLPRPSASPSRSVTRTCAPASPAAG